MLRSWSLNTIFHSKEPGVLEEVVDSRSEERKMQDELRISGGLLKEDRGQLDGAPNG